MNDKKNNSNPETLIKQLDQTMVEMRQAIARLRHCAERSNAALTIQAQQNEVQLPKETAILNGTLLTAKNDSAIVLH
ncbi:hypothetical protein NBRC116493_06330 [Aurantivibrio infirmus]